jgi:hypothetical protein
MKTLNMHRIHLLFSICDSTLSYNPKHPNQRGLYAYLLALLADLRCELAVIVWVLESASISEGIGGGV